MSSANINNTMENALKCAITAAVKKLEFKKYDVPEDNVVDCFLTDLFGILFPNNSGLVKERKKPGPKPKLDEHGNPIKSPRKSKKSEGPAAAGAGSPVKERKKPGPKPKLDADGNPIAKKKAKKDPAERKKPGPKPKLDADGNPVNKKAKAAAKKPLPASPAASPKKAGAAKPNIEWSPTWTKRVKPVVKELGIELRLTPAKQKEFAAHLNGLSKSDYDAKTFEEHMRDLLRPATAAAPEAVAAPPPPPPGGAAAAGDDSDDEVEMTEVTFKGKTYSVDTRDRKRMAVYDEDATEHLGYVGSGEFVGMVVPADADSDAESEDEE